MRLKVEPWDVLFPVVVDVGGDSLGREVVAEMLEKRAQLLGRKEVEQHQHVGLLRDLIAVRRITLGLQDAIQPLNVAIAWRDSHPSPALRASS